MAEALFSGRCYCGQATFKSNRSPETVAFCHCGDCKRWTGSPAPAFAAFEEGALTFTPALSAAISINSGVDRWNCPKCGSPLAARFDYLPDQIYIPLGLLDQADALPARLHCHAEKSLAWLHISDDLPRSVGTARAELNSNSS
ncbi:GFA family protein [Planktotalea sp.]|uniref:GFA family protein n=1 Tax=Planktotalea sp. TaxID=2029877 RepID=UPI003D6A70C3